MRWRNQSNVALGAAVVSVLALATVVAAAGMSPHCDDVRPEVLAKIASYSPGAPTPVLSAGKVLPVTLTYPSGFSEPGYLVASSTPSGVAVWGVNSKTYADGGEVIQALNEAARATAYWGGGKSPNPMHVSEADIAQVEVCAA